jgi:acetyl-CoA acyltransferase
MTRVPMGGFNPMYDQELAEKGFYMGMGDTAENLASDGSISREDQDEFAAASHRKALAAWERGAFAREVVSIDLPDGESLERDEVPQEPNMEKIQSLSPAFKKDGTVTAASSSPVTIGAVAAILVAEDVAEELGLEVRAWIRTTAVAGCEWDRMGKGPIPATEKALTRAGLKMDDLAVIELNEAFAAQSLYVIREGGFPEDKTNTLGGAIALGHPLGMSGLRIIGTSITALEESDGQYALATMCIGGGQGVATILEKAGA